MGRGDSAFAGGATTVPENDMKERIEDAVGESIDELDVDADADVDVAHHQHGVRLRTNVQAGPAGERAEVTLEHSSPTMSDLVVHLDAYNQVLADEIEMARTEARRNA